MSKTKPLFGSKISLISKAEIRYEGTLYEVDAENSTVTLAKGRQKLNVLYLFINPRIYLLLKFGLLGLREDRQQSKFNLATKCTSILYSEEMT